MAEVFVNKVAESGIITIDLEQYFPKEEVVSFDLKPFLFMELILKEKDFRAALPEHNWDQYAGKVVAVFCSADAIIPVWAYMLVASHLQPMAKEVFFGTVEEVQRKLLSRNLSEIDPKTFEDKRVVLKGCGELEIGAHAYLELTAKLRPVVKSIMYGEPCSTVPVYKKKAAAQPPGQ